MSLKARFRRIEAGVLWLETEGVFLNIEAKMKLVKKLQEISDYIASNPAAAGRLKAVGLGMKLPPAARPLEKPPDKPAPLADPKPALVPQPPPSVIAAPPAPVVKTPPPRPPDAPDPPAPPPGMPGTPPSPDMEIRPVRWRERGSRDAYGHSTYGQCLTEYDVLRDEDDD